MRVRHYTRRQNIADVKIAPPKSPREHRDDKCAMLYGRYTYSITFDLVVNIMIRGEQIVAFACSLSCSPCLERACVRNVVVTFRLFSNQGLAGTLFSTRLHENESS